MGKLTMRYTLKALLLSGLTIFTAGFLLAGAVQAQEVTIALPPGELGATTYNPVTASNLNSAASLIYDRLVEQDADQSFHPHLATSWTESPDGMTWTFKLHPGVQFQDGTPFNAKAVAEWIPDFAGTSNSYLTAAIDRVEVVDNLTVVFHMKHPDPNLLFNLSSVFMGVPSPTAYTKLGADYGVKGAVGTGPFKLKKFDVGLDTVLVRNDDYAWASDLSVNQGPAHLAKVTFREIPNQSTAFLDLKTGSVDMLMGVPTDFLSLLAAEPKIKVIQMPGTGIDYMPINVTSAPFDDIRVREATVLAINQDAIVKSVYNGVGMAAHNFLISSLPASKVDPKLDDSYDPAKAAHLLDEAGWKMGPNGIREKNGKPMTVKLYTQNGTEFTNLTQVIQAQLKAIGMDAKITVFDSSTIRDEYKKGTQQLAVRGYDWNNADILDWFFNGDSLGYPNVSMWNDPKGQALDKVAMAESKTSKERSDNFKAFHEYILSQYVFAPIYQPTINIAYNSNKITVSAAIRGPRFRSQSVVDMDVVK
ncbi:ABC transporter substrate-binding protein [Thioclava sp. 15-R06ZXC-3]|uniref:ABC transporter substrate-binding protein n=1 Tax=Thioclava arctica TaxID=3238301 RepID=A0ABV3TPC9_9RHOB